MSLPNDTGDSGGLFNPPYYATYNVTTYEDIVSELNHGKTLYMIVPEEFSDEGSVYLGVTTQTSGNDWLRLTFKGEKFIFCFDSVGGWSCEKIAGVDYVKPGGGIPMSDLSRDLRETIDAAHELPEAASNDIGKVVGVVEDVHGGPTYGLVDGGADEFVVVFSGLTREGNAACDKTWNEIVAAHDAGKKIRAIYRHTFYNRNGDVTEIFEYEMNTYTLTAYDEFIKLGADYTRLLDSRRVEGYSCYIRGNLNIIECYYYSYAIPADDGEAEDEDEELLH